MDEDVEDGEYSPSKRTSRSPNKRIGMTARRDPDSDNEDIDMMNNGTASGDDLMEFSADQFYTNRG